MSAGAVRRSFHVTGRVQGVFFRARTRDQARRMALAGWVRNRDDGTVEGEVQGDGDAVAAFTAWLEDGPERAEVDGVRLGSLTPIPGDVGFEIR